MAWDFERGGLVEPSPRRDVCTLPDALRRVLGAPGAAYAQGLALGLRGVSQAYGLGWRVEVCGAAVRVEAQGNGRGRRRAAVLVRRGDWTCAGGVVEALCRLGQESALPLHI